MRLEWLTIMDNRYTRNTCISLPTTRAKWPILVSLCHKKKRQFNVFRCQCWFSISWFDIIYYYFSFWYIIYIYLSLKIQTSSHIFFSKSIWNIDNHTMCNKIQVNKISKNHNVYSKYKLLFNKYMPSQFLLLLDSMYRP